MLLVRQRTQHILSFKSLVSRNLGFSIDTNHIRKLKREDINSWFKNDHLRFSAQTNIDAIDFLKREIADLERIIINSSNLRFLYELLSSIPGIGKTLSMTIALETGEISRFKTVEDLCPLGISGPRKNLGRPAENRLILMGACTLKGVYTRRVFIPEGCLYPKGDWSKHLAC